MDPFTGTLSPNIAEYHLSLVPNSSQVPHDIEAVVIQYRLHLQHPQHTWTLILGLQDTQGVLLLPQHLRHPLLLIWIHSLGLPDTLVLPKSLPPLLPLHREFRW